MKRCTWGAVLALAAALTLGLLSRSSVAAAAEPSDPSEDAMVEAKIHFQAGKAYYDKEKFRQAITEFEAGYDLIKKPAFLLNIAQSYKRLGNNQKAREYYQTYLAADPQSPQRPQVEKLIAEIDVELAKSNDDDGGPASPPPSGPGVGPVSDDDPFAPSDAKNKPKPRPRVVAARPTPKPVVAPPPAETTETDETDGNEADETPPTRASLTPKPKPPEGSLVDGKPAKDEESKPLLAKPWFWTLVVLGLGGGVAAAYILTSNKGYVTDGSLGTIDARRKM